MIKYDTIFLDRDGTLNFDPGFINNVEDFRFFNFTIPALKILSERGQRFCIVTNQSGVGRGLITEAELNEIHDYIRKIFSENDINLMDIIVCHDHPDEATKRRKPETGMFLEIAKKYEIILEECLIIGDSENDTIPAQKLGMESMLVLTGNGHLTLDNITPQNKPTYIVENILEGAKKIISMGDRIEDDGEVTFLSNMATVALFVSTIVTMASIVVVIFGNL